MQLEKGEETVLVIPDLQAPFEHKDAVPFLQEVAAACEVTKVVCIGDSMDAHALSRWAHDPDGWGAGHEYALAIEHLNVLYDAFPVAKEVISNHNERIAKRVFDAGIPREMMRSYEDIMSYPEGWSIHPWVEIDGIMYEHGHAHGGMYAARNAAISNGQSTVIGHHHSHAAVQYIANRRRMIFGMNVGCLIDLDSYAFAYAAESKFKPTLGCGVVIQGVPYFIPMLIDEHKRWTGELLL